MKRLLFLFVVLVIALIVFVFFLTGNMETNSIGVLPIVLFAIVILSIGGFFLYSQYKGEDADALAMSFQPVPKNEWGKIIFASLGASLAFSLIMLMISFVIFDHEIIVSYVKKFFFVHLIVVQLICIPILKKFMKK